MYSILALIAIGFASITASRVVYSPPVIKATAILLTRDIPYPNNTYVGLQDPKLPPHEIGNYLGANREDGILENHSSWGDERRPC
jgi:hypothetical protein